MPDSYGKRQRNAKKARKFAEREERRLARKQQRADQEAGVPEGEASEGSSEGEANAVPEGDVDSPAPGSGPEADSRDA
ncbi:MAG: hypothetical protein ACRDKA_04750 [Actinomycetota bacterium]